VAEKENAGKAAASSAERGRPSQEASTYVDMGTGTQAPSRSNLAVTPPGISNAATTEPLGVLKNSSGIVSQPLLENRLATPEGIVNHYPLFLYFDTIVIEEYLFSRALEGPSRCGQL
jgi:hypothetical protein